MSGVSSMITSTPVAVSKARMFRPSRPMMRPFISSLGSATAATVVSAVCSAASRWMAMAMIRRASRSAPRLACSLMSRASACGLAPGLVLDPLEDLAPGVLRGEPGDPLELEPLLLGQPVGLALARPERSAPARRQRLLAVRRSSLPAHRSPPASAPGRAARSSARRSSRSHSSRRRWISRSSSSRSLSVSILAASSTAASAALGVALRLRAEPLGLAARGVEDAGGAAPLMAGVEQRSNEQGSRPVPRPATPHEHRPGARL